MSIIGIIPARMGSSRFPGKPLAKICGLSMVEHVYRRSAMSRSLDAVYIATCDEQIRQAAEGFGAQAIMTLDSHERASDRVAEALLKIEAQLGKRIDIVVMIQGDEPMLFPDMVDRAVMAIKNDSAIEVVNLFSPIGSGDEFEDPNEVKVVFDKDNWAMYFSREPIPSRKKCSAEVFMFKQVCIIPFRRDFLLKFNKLAQTHLEIIESVDMLRILENGYKIKMVNSGHITYSVDTVEDLTKVDALMVNDPLMGLYKKG